MNLFTHSPRIVLMTSVLTLSLFSTMANAEEHAAHEHGAARLTIATNDKGVEISLESPAANVFGFEYVASSDGDHHTIHEAVKTLEQGDSLFLANASAGCKQTSIEIESAQVDAHKEAKHKDHDDHDDEKHEAHDEHDEEKHDATKHDDHDDEKHEAHDKHDEHDHEDEKHDDHKDAHDHEGETTTHNDVDATWQFTCSDTKALEKLEVKLFTAFPKGFADLDIDWVTETKSGHIQLETDGIVLLK